MATRSASQHAETNQDHQVRSLNSSPGRPQARRLVPLKQEEFDRLSGNANRSELPSRQKLHHSKSSTAREIASNCAAQEYAEKPRNPKEVAEHVRRSSSRLHQHSKNAPSQRDLSSRDELIQDQEEIRPRQEAKRILKELIQPND